MLVTPIQFLHSPKALRASEVAPAEMWRTMTWRLFMEPCWGPCSTNPPATQACDEKSL